MNTKYRVFLLSLAAACAMFNNSAYCDGAETARKSAGMAGIGLCIAGTYTLCKGKPAYALALWLAGILTTALGTNEDIIRDRWAYEARQQRVDPSFAETLQNTWEDIKTGARQVIIDRDKDITGYKGHSQACKNCWHRGLVVAAALHAGNTAYHGTRAATRDLLFPVDSEEPVED